MLLLALTLAAPPAAPSFVRDVEPILTRAGCNSGACHGALAGKGGFRLSLRGYDPAADHFAITREAQARRYFEQIVDLAAAPPPGVPWWAWALIVLGVANSAILIYMLLSRFF